MTIRQTINLLRSQGHKVTYYERRDGGVLIKSIDGQRFTGATGNLYARAMSGQSLSVKRATQLGNITWSGERAKSQISYKNIDIKRKLEQVQRKWNKTFKERGLLEVVGRKTAKKVKWNIEHKGAEETMRLLNEAERYASGIAYSKNIEYMVTIIRDAAKRLKSVELEDFADEIVDNAFKIEEDSILPTYQILYDLNKVQNKEDIKEVIRRARISLNID